MIKKISCILCSALISTFAVADTVSLIDKLDPVKGWTFDNGREFGGGAQGSLEAVADEGVPTFKLSGDFSKAGIYVQMAKKVDVNIETLMFDVKASKGQSAMTMRLIDKTGQCHQIKIGLKDDGEWQSIVFPVKEFFKNKGTSSAVSFVKQYENWGGAKDGKWTNPLSTIVFLYGKRKNVEPKGFLEFKNIKLITAKPEEEKIYAPQRLKLDEILQVGEIDWKLYLGDAAGTTGDMKLLENVPEKGDYGLAVSADFSKTVAGKPQYIAVSYATKYPSSVKFKRLNFKYRSTNISLLSLRLTDGSGQTHQVRRNVEADGQWHEYGWTIKDIVGRESWGGAKDKKWHDSVNSIAFIIGNRAGAPKQVAMDISAVSFDVEMASAKVETVYSEEFENGIDGWTIDGKAAVTKDDPFDGKSAFVLTRSSMDSEKAEAYGPTFFTKANKLKISGATSSQLEGLDNSFMGLIGIQWLDSNDKPISSDNLFNQWRRQNWQKFSEELVVPNGASKARFFVKIQKATGDYYVDGLKVETVAASSLFQERISKVKIALDCVGNMPFPGDDIVFKITPMCEKPLPKSWLNVYWTITDYWGNEVFSSKTPVPLEKIPKKKNGKTFDYKAEVDVTKLPLEVGKYYEMHISIPRDGAEDYSDYKSFAILPEPETFKYSAKDIPFTTRSWDNRIPDYLKLSHRIGHRTAGIWGRFSKKPPYKASLANVKLANELEMSMLSSTEIHMIEKHRKGWEDMTVEIMTKGTKSIINDPLMTNLIYMSLGNEPPMELERAKEVLPYYKSAYEAIKKDRPDIQVIGTAVGPSEPYFQSGFGAYQDAYDFHTYEDYRKIPSIFAKYKTLFKKYGHEKPICSTEIGLNSQGQPRYDVALSLVKKVSIFFECGGSHVSWFGIMYPDPSGKSFGGSGDAHNTFDCRYNVYSPRLDAIAYYYMMNGILDKKFVEKKVYGTTEIYLFADANGNCFTVVWNDKQSEMIELPLSGVSDVEVVRVDNSSQKMAVKGSITLRVSEEPIMLKYKQEKAILPNALAKPSFSLVGASPTMAKGSTDAITIVGEKLSDKDFIVKVPNGWKSSLVDDGGSVKLTLSVSQDAMGRIGRVYIQYAPGGKVSGEAVLSIPLAPPLEVIVTALAKEKGKAPSIKLTLKNNGTKDQEAFWDIKILGQLDMAEGSYQLSQLIAPTAFFSGDSSGMEELKAGEVKEILIPVSKFDGTTIYKVKAKVSDSTGRSSLAERYIGGLAGAKKTAVAPKIDGKLDDSCWQKAVPVYIMEEKQMYNLKHQLKDGDGWNGVDDLSAEIRYAWDDNYLYVAVSGKDDVFANPGTASSLWRMDGIQMLVDPCREKAAKSGKYDYVFGNGQDGPQAWCSLSANSRVPSGLVDSIKIDFDDELVKHGQFAYEIAIPWNRVYPFEPSVGGNLGIALIMNEDDGPGRASFMGWFSGVHSKQLDLVGDVILQD